jgi:phosphoglycolate phosphatase-like HAD superfamily hydrolase
MPATHALHETIALVFDFDLTLAPSSDDTLLKVLEIDRDEWNRRWLKPLMKSGWDEMLARGYGLIEAAKEKGRRLDRDAIRETARRIEPFPGVTEMFDRLRAAAEEVCPGVRLDFTILSSGFADIIVETELAKKFDRVWGSAFHEDESGAAVFVKRTINHPEKALYLAALAKGIPIEGADSPEGTAREVEEEKMRFPVDQLIYVGDGASDLEAFSYVEGGGGLAIAVAKEGRFDAEAKMLKSQKVDNLAPPDFTEGGQMLQSLIYAVRSAAARIALRRFSRGE